MDLNEAEEMIYAWGMWERGRSDGIALAIEKVENLLCQQDVSGQQRTVLLGLYDSFLEAKAYR
jgi:hypothetical protein